MDNLLNENFKPRSPLKGGPPGASLNQIRMSQIEANVPQGKAPTLLCIALWMCQLSQGVLPRDRKYNQDSS